MPVDDLPASVALFQNDCAESAALDVSRPDVGGERVFESRPRRFAVNLHLQIRKRVFRVFEFFEFLRPAVLLEHLKWQFNQVQYTYNNNININEFNKNLI